MSAFAFRRHESPAESLRRIVADLLQSIRELLPRAEACGHSLHEISKATKRIRAIVSLAPGSDGRPVRKSLQRFRRPIGARRDAEVMRTLWGEFSERAAKMDSTRTQDLNASWSHPDDRRIETLPTMAEWLALLDRVERDWTRLELPGTRTAWFLDAVRKEYRRGGRIVGAGLCSASDHRLHKLRKAVKQTQSHLELLQKACPARLIHEHDLWQRLGELLGRHHDLSVFRETLSRSHLDRRARLPTGSINAVLEQEREELTRTICREATQIYLVRPRTFAQTLHCAWKLWHRPVGQE